MKKTLLKTLLISTFGVAGFALYRKFQQERETTIADLSRQSQLAQTAVGPIEYATTGHGIPVLIAHGGGGGYDQALCLARIFGGDNIHYIAPSRFGYLRSPMPADASPEAQADAFAALLDALNVPQAFVIGMSAGGMSAVQFALRHPKRCLGLVMVSAISRRPVGVPMVSEAAMQRFFHQDFLPWLALKTPFTAVLRQTLNQVPLAQIQEDPETAVLAHGLFQSNFPASLRYQGLAKDLANAMVLPDHPLSRITVPTLALHAENDPIVPFRMAQYIAQTIPGAQLVSVPNGGHMCCALRRDALNPALHTFLKQG